VLPFVIVLVVVMVALGGAFLFSTVQSKNTFQLFYRADLSRLVAESAVSEWRAFFPEHARSFQPLRAMLENPTAMIDTPNGRERMFARIPHESIPHTLAMADRLIGRGNYRLDTKMVVGHVDDVLEEKVIDGPSKFSAFRGEYQAALLVEVRVTFTRASEHQESVFWFEFDLKRACLRSDRAHRAGGGYTSNATNDYVLFLRNAGDEFRQVAERGPSFASSNGRMWPSAFNADEFPLSVKQKNGRGKFLFATVDPGSADARTHSCFLNVTPELRFLLPPNPGEINIPWPMLERFTPTIANDLRNLAEAAARLQPGLDPTALLNQVRAQILIDYQPLVGDAAWQARLSGSERNRARSTGRGFDRRPRVQVLQPRPMTRCRFGLKAIPDRTILPFSPPSKAICANASGKTRFSNSIFPSSPWDRISSRSSGRWKTTSMLPFPS
jgi:hypothetical protein